LSGCRFRPVIQFATLYENNASPSARVRSLRVVGSSNLPRDGQAELPAISIDFVGNNSVKQRVRNLCRTGPILAQFGASATSHSYNSCNSSRLAPAMVKPLRTAPGVLIRATSKACFPRAHGSVSRRASSIRGTFPGPSCCCFHQRYESYETGFYTHSRGWKSNLPN
jgi:hypothetical protein